MKPSYKCGYHAPSLIGLIIRLIYFFTLPLSFPLMIKNIITYNNITTNSYFTIIIYLITLIIALLVICSFHNTNVYLFYHNFMLYKEKINLFDRIKLILMKDDLNKLENYLDKRNYVNIRELKIVVKKNYHVRTNDYGIMISFKLIFNDNKTFDLNVREDTKADYKQFLAPFINYHIKINDPDDLISGLNQPLRLTEYFIQKSNNQ